ncbi:tRNA (adenosine(37)-N6)-threonylcarbamoyltransferase complex dimerization subunit type 1 TsaB [Oceaniferula spumae]|uniref:tRNA (Adenosine(37)-N6)-threonylcarbamoyltransferase complex dimerization subunit type 1 TsaB n=1 Tax=Oceaniferula spumae TaxID=2979115 RepID=A0AAT9FLP9_9BACT
METESSHSSNQAILAIETSVPEASITLWCDGSVAYQHDFTSDRNHNSMIFEPLGEALKILDGRKLDLILVGTGPGSYSGARTGIAAGQGVAIANGCPAVGIGSLAATPVARAEKSAAAVGDARRGLYYISEIASNGEANEPQLMPAAEFQEVVCTLHDKGDVSFFTLDDPSGAWLNPIEMPTQVRRTRPEASALIEVWLGLTSERQQQLVSQPLAPTYLRPPFTSKAKLGHPLLRPS